MTHYQISKIIERISLNCFGINFNIRVEIDQKYGKRSFIQIEYDVRVLRLGKYFHGEEENGTFQNS